MTESFERLGFLSLNRTETGDGYVGALLVTDSNGIPLEFRVTQPVKPTLIQKPLYGDRLEPYVGVMLCGKQLLAAAEKSPQIILVASESLLDLREETTIPVVFVRDAGQAIEIAGDSRDERPKTRVNPISTTFRPLILAGHKLDAAAFDELRVRLERLTAQLDLLEPFNRTTEAIKVLAKQDKRFQ